MTSPQNFPGRPSMPPPFGPPGGMPGFPPGFPPGGQPGFPPGGGPGFPPGTPGGGPTGQMPTGAPPAFTPAMTLSHQGSTGLRSCLFAYTYIWTYGGSNFWFYPIALTRDQVMGYRWSTRNNRWSFRIISRNNIWSFQCFR